MTGWVLIVDDEEMIRENLKAYLEDEGLGVAAFESATGALFWRRTRTPGPLATTPSTPENPPHQEQPCTSSAVAP